MTTYPFMNPLLYRSSILSLLRQAFTKVAPVLTLALATFLVLQAPTRAEAQITVANGGGPAGVFAEDYVYYGVPGNGTINVFADPGQKWNITFRRGYEDRCPTAPVDPSCSVTDLSWMTVSVAQGYEGTGNGSINYSYTKLERAMPRTVVFEFRAEGSSTIVAQYNFVHDPPEATVSVNPTVITDTPGYGVTTPVTVTVTPFGANWSATSNRPWIEVIGGTGSGSGSFQVKLAPNFSTASRTGSVTVSDKVIQVTQGFATATFELGSNSAHYPYEGGNGNVPVTVDDPNAPWTAVSNNPWITITNGGSHTGSGTVQYTVALNPDEEPRTGTITIAGKTFTVTQDENPGEPPATLSVNPTSLSYTYTPGRSAVLDRTVTVSSSGDAIQFSVQINGASWLSTTTNTATTSATVSFVAAPENLPVGTYTGSILFKEVGGDRQATVPVTLNVQPRTDTLPNLTASPRSLYFKRALGSSVPAPQRIKLGANANSPVNFTMDLESSIWLNVQTVSDNLGSGIIVSVRNLNMLPGVYDAKITVKSPTFAFADVEIPIRYVVTLSGGSGPSILSGGIVNGATFVAGGAPGTWISVFGSGLANSTRSWNPNQSQGSLLPTNLDGTEVLIGGVSAPISFVSPTQVNALVPNVTLRGWVPIEVRVNNTPTEGGYIYLRDTAPALFVYSQQGGRYVAAQHPDSTATAVGPVGLFPGGPASRPATSAQIITVYATGFGRTNPAIDPATFFKGSAALLDSTQFQLRVGGLPAQIQYVGLVAPGLYQVNLVLPSLTTGEYYVNADVDTMTTQPGVMVPVIQ